MPEEQGKRQCPHPERPPVAAMEARAFPAELEEYLAPVAVDWRPNAAERALLRGASSPQVYKFAWPDTASKPPPEVKYLRVTAGRRAVAARPTLARP